MKWVRPGLIIAAAVLLMVVALLLVTRGTIVKTEPVGQEAQAEKGYNLSWAQPPEPVALTIDEEIVIENQVSMQSWTTSGEPAEGESLIEACGAAPWVYWYLAGEDGTPVRDLRPKVMIPEDLRSGGASVIRMTVTALPDDPRSGYVVGVIDLPGVMAAAGDEPEHALVAEVVAAGRKLDLTPQPPCSEGKQGEVREIPGEAEPLSGLADNVLRIPYTIREEVAQVPEPEPAPRPAQPPASQPAIEGGPAPEGGAAPDPDPEPDPVPAPPAQVFHDCRISSLRAFRSPIVPDWIQWELGLNYDTNSGDPGIFAQYRVWARTGPNSTAPDEAWQPVTLPARPESWVLEGAFEGLSDGYWEIAAEVSCPGDGSPANNMMVVPVDVTVSGPAY